MRTLSLLTAVLLLPLAASQAAETEWQEVMPGVKLRLVSSGEIRPDGTTLLGLEIDMPEDTKTYWRVPGETGIAPTLDFSGSRGVVSGEIIWPMPTRDTSTGFLDYAYFGHTLLPISVKASDPTGSALVSALLGICSDICVPAQANFTLPLGDAAPDRPNSLRIRQALAEAPIAWDGGEDPFGKVEYLPDEKALGVWITNPAIDVSTLIASTETGEPVFGMPQKSRQDDLVLLPILTKTENSDLKGQDVQLTFMTGMGAYELGRTIDGNPAGK